MSLAEQIIEIEKLGYYDAVYILKAYQDRPEDRLYVSLGKIVDKLIKEIDELTETPIIKGDDKIFERVNTIIVKFNEYKESFENGRRSIVVVDKDYSGDNPLFTNNGGNNNSKKRKESAL